MSKEDKQNTNLNNGITSITSKENLSQISNNGNVPVAGTLQMIGIPMSMSSLVMMPFSTGRYSAILI